LANTHGDSFTHGDTHGHPNVYTYAHSDVHDHTDTHPHVYSDTHGHADSHAYVHGHTDTHPYARRLKAMLEVVHLFQLRSLLINLAQVETKWIRGLVKCPTICPWARLRRNPSLSLKVGIST
jgi:hypothetical protein